MAQDLTLAMRLLLNAQQFVSGLTGSRTAVNKFVSGARSEFNHLQSAYQSVTGRIAALGVGVGATATIIKSAQLDKNLAQIGLTAGAGAGQIETLRNRLFTLSKQSGKSVEDLMQGFNSLVQSGLAFDPALATLDGINQAMAVSGANAEVLARGLTVAARAFQFDLSNPQKAVLLLEQMTVGGRLGNAELEALSGVFGRVGNPSANAGMSFTETLAMAEGLSQGLPGQPDRLGTRMESTLRFFNNYGYLTAAEKHGVKFFKDGKRIPTFDVLEQLKTRVDKTGDDQEARVKLIGKLLAGMDVDTATGLNELITGGNLNQVRGFNTTMMGAGGIFKDDMKVALDNAIDQSGRLKNTLREAADGFAQPINDSLNKLIKYALDKKEDGGLGLSGGQIAAIGVGALVGGYALKRVGGIVGNLAGTAGGIAAGKTAEALAGVTPVYVTNWSDMPGGAGGIDALGGVAAGGAAVKVLSDVKLLAAAPLGIIKNMGPRVIAGATGMVGAAGLAGYGVGTLISKAIEGTRFSDALGEKIARALAAVGNDNASAALASRDRYDREFQGTLKIELASNDMKAQVREFRSNSPSLNMEIDHRGTMMVLP